MTSSRMLSETFSYSISHHKTTSHKIAKYSYTLFLTIELIEYHQPTSNSKPPALGNNTNGMYNLEHQ